MRTWWIVRVCGELYVWGYYYKPLMILSPNIGPFWSYEEAKELLEKWV